MAAAVGSKKVTYALIWASIWILCSSSSSSSQAAAAVVTHDDDNPYATLSSINDTSSIEAVERPLPPPMNGSETPVPLDEDEDDVDDENHWWVDLFFSAGEVFFFVAWGSVVVCTIVCILKIVHKECGKGVPVTV
ncbi:unnamed protein product [Linum tenue]|uniref:Transmembrane protein n=1 Tax=Linum tenue TaxID=586396 RepID=A0AAV0RC52_9ROSI|nr:unnamed protein product [Linum tenue]CAI0555233.1 unnamed protein product [Linum tenue]